MKTAAHFRQDVEVLRGLAVLCVVVYHSTSALPGGYLGVDVFFVISGFVITAQVDRETQMILNPSRLLDFWRRRVARIVPNLLVVVPLWVVISVVVQERETFLATVNFAGWAFVSLGNFAAMRDVGSYFGTGIERQGLLHLWSLGVEEQFYLIFPILGLVASRLARRRDRRQILALLVGLMLLLSLSLFWAWGNRLQLSVLGFRLYEVFAFYSPLTRAWQLCAGVLVALWLPIGVTQRSREMATAIRCLGIGLIFAALLVGSERNGAIKGSVMSSVGAVVWILAGDMRSENLRVLQPLVRLGGISYAVYLLHLPLLVAARSLVGDIPLVAALAGVCSVPLGALLAAVVERPWRSRVIRTKRAWPFAVVTAMAGLTLLGPAPRLLQAELVRHLPPSSPGLAGRQVAQCVDTEVSDRQCWFGPEKSARYSAFLVGDSIAYAVSEGVIGAVKATGGRIFVSSRSGCPFVAGMSSGGKPLDCNQWQRQIRQLITVHRPEVVILAHRTSGYTRVGEWRTMVGPSGEDPQTDREAIEMWISSLDGIQQWLRSHNAHVIVMRNQPDIDPLLYPDNSLARRLLKLPTRSVVKIDPDDREIAGWMAEVALARRRRGGAYDFRTLDIWETICPRGVCQLWHGGSKVFEDKTHLSATGSSLLESQFKVALRELGL